MVRFDRHFFYLAGVISQMLLGGLFFAVLIYRGGASANLADELTGGDMVLRQTSVLLVYFSLTFVLILACREGLPLRGLNALRASVLSLGGFSLFVAAAKPDGSQELFLGGALAVLAVLSVWGMCLRTR